MLNWFNFNFCFFTVMTVALTSVCSFAVWIESLSSVYCSKCDLILGTQPLTNKEQISTVSKIVRDHYRITKKTHKAIQSLNVSDITESSFVDWFTQWLIENNRSNIIHTNIIPIHLKHQINNEENHQLNSIN
jgi:hypothetical protein